MRFINKEGPTTELPVLGSSSQATGKTFYIDRALVVAKNLRYNVMIQTASSSEAEILSAKGTNLFS